MEMIKLNKTSKMNCFSFSLDARKCVTGSKLRLIAGSTCSKCYALKGNYNYPSVQQNREKNLYHLENKYFVEVMAFQLQDHKFFRWFDSGDIPHLEGLKKIIRIAELTPHCKHWLPTRELKLIKEYKGTFPNWIITDVRFHNEVKAIKDRKGILVRVERPAIKFSNHESETTG